MSDSNHYLASCDTPEAIERVFQAAIRHDVGGDHSAIQRACNDRAYAIASRYPRGQYLAKRIDKGRGNSRRYEVAGEEYRTGTWGNGAGFRWSMAGFKAWYEDKLRESGLRSKRKIDSIISWVECGCYWRALRELAK